MDSERWMLDTIEFDRAVQVAQDFARENGDTLVVDTIGLAPLPKSFIDNFRTPHSEKLHLVERYRRLNANTMRFTVTIEDPVMYTAPWSTSYIYRVNPGTEIMEYWCTENEKDRIHMVGK